MVIPLAIFMLVLVVVVAGVGAGLWLAFRWMRQFTPEREGELLAELAGLRASQRLGREAGRRHLDMLRSVVGRAAEDESG